MEKTALFLPRFPRIERITVVVGQCCPMLLVLLGVVSVATFATILFARMGFTGRESVNDPFIAYADVFPGQPRSAALTREFLCQGASVPSPADVVEDCRYYLQTGPLSHIRLTLWDGIIVRTDFSVRANTITMGNLILWWGAAEFQSSGELWLLKWGNRRMTTGYVRNGRYTYFSLVSQVSFTR